MVKRRTSRTRKLPQPVSTQRKRPLTREPLLVNPFATAYQVRRRRRAPVISIRSLSAIEDYRRQPKTTWPRMISSKPARVTPRPRGSLAPLKFAHPKRTIVCVRRKTRKQVMFAKGQAGRPGRQRRPRYNPNSKIRC